MNLYNDNSNPTNSDTHESPDNRSGLIVATRICGYFSMTFGILSVSACCLGYLSIPIGAMGILFAMLSRRNRQPLNPLCKTGLYLSVIGLIIGFVMMLIILYATITDPSFWEYTQELMQLYGEI